MIEIIEQKENNKTLSEILGKSPIVSIIDKEPHRTIVKNNLQLFESVSNESLVIPMITLGKIICEETLKHILTQHCNYMEESLVSMDIVELLQLSKGFIIDNVCSYEAFISAIVYFIDSRFEEGLFLSCYSEDAAILERLVEECKIILDL